MEDPVFAVLGQLDSRAAGQQWSARFNLLREGQSLNHDLAQTQFSPLQRQALRLPAEAIDRQKGEYTSTGVG